MGLPRSDIMREALEAAVGADVPLDEARKQEEAAEAVLRGRKAARVALEAREAREARKREVEAARESAINELRGHFSTYANESRKPYASMASWVRSRQAEIPKLRTMETMALLDRLLEAR